mmetsp:Transcript_32685/g.105585  ORF Transcript_32685/g.105585 Transcript_32685/m.105585 type:complete len:84 (+) Transcript_32685:144-395(+)
MPRVQSEPMFGSFTPRFFRCCFCSLLLAFGARTTYAAVCIFTAHCLGELDIAFTAARPNNIDARHPTPDNLAQLPRVPLLLIV